MKKMNIYDLYMDDGHSTFKVTVPAFSKKDAKEYVQGNGDVVARAISTLVTLAKIFVQESVIQIVVHHNCYLLPFGLLLFRSFLMMLV